MYLFVFIEHLHNWEMLDIQLTLPKGVPLEPLGIFSVDMPIMFF